MTSPPLRGLEKKAEVIVDSLLATGPGLDALFQVSWPSGTGSRSLLRRVGSGVAKQGLVPIVLDVDPGAMDVDAQVAARICLGLQAAGIPEPSVVLEQHRPWRDKIRSLADGLRSVADRVVLLAVHPRRWADAKPDWSIGDSEEHGGPTTGPARALSDLVLAHTEARRIVVGEVPESALARSIEAWHPSGFREWLEGPEWWRSLSSSARKLARQFGPRLDVLTMLEVRLLVLAVEFGAEEAIPELLGLPEATRHRSLAHRIGELFAGSTDDSRVETLDAWRRLSLVRGPAPPGLYRSLTGALSSSRARDLLELGLLYQENEDWVLHPTLRPPPGSLGVAERGHTHREIALWYTEALKPHAAGAAQEALVQEVEAYHHATQAHDEELLQALRPYFSTQLDALGRVLSRAGHYAEAAEVFQRATRWDPEDDYAIHYRGFNLDVDARDPGEAERCYRKAIELAPHKPWWNSRLVTFLISRSQIPAARQAWSETLSNLRNPDGRFDGSVFDHVHKWVIGYLLERNQFGFAREVIADVAAAGGGTPPWLAAYRELLEAFEAAERNQSVFPLGLDPARWWQGPHLFPNLRNQTPKVRWLAGFVESVDGQGIRFRVGEPPPVLEGEPRFGSMQMTSAAFDQACRNGTSADLSPGRFLEMVLPDEHGDPVVMLYDDRAFVEARIPALFPDPRRYLKRRGWTG